MNIKVNAQTQNRYFKNENQQQTDQDGEEKIPKINQGYL